MTSEQLEDLKDDATLRKRLAVTGGVNPRIDGDAAKLKIAGPRIT
jgi:hypothetical protein